MNRLTATLAVTTLVAAVAAIHYAHAWQQLRGVDAGPMHATVAAAPPSAIQPGQLDAVGEAPVTPAGGARPLPSEEAVTRVIGVGRDPVSLAVARHRLAGLRDPQQRALRAKEVMDLFLSGGWEIVAPRIGITDDELTRYLQVRAERVLQRREQLIECQIAATCDVDALRTAHNGAARRDEEELLGPDRYASLRAIQQSSQEHQFAQQLNRRLPAGSTLSGADVSRLALALAEERQRFNEQVEHDGLRGMGYISGSFLLLNAATVAGASDEHARLRESASDYGRRLAGRAAAVLTPEQFGQFRTVLDAELTVFQSQLREWEIEAALRRQARQASAP